MSYLGLSKFSIGIKLALLAMLVLLQACGSEESSSNELRSNSIADRENTIVLTHDGWRGTFLPNAVLRLILEKELGYEVEVIDQKTVPNAFESVALGHTDIFASGWFPARDFTFSKYPHLVKLGQLYGGGAKDAYEGWMLTKDSAQQFGVVHVEDLQDRSLARSLDTDGNGLGNIIGCPNDWVCASRNPEILEDFGLNRLYEIDEQPSEKAMLSAIEERLKDGKPALFYMLQPGGLSRDLRVSDHANWLLGTEAYLPLSFNRAIVANEFIASHPDVAQLLSVYRISGADIATSMSDIAKKKDDKCFIEDLAEEWIKTNRAQVDSWLQGVAKRPTATETTPMPVAYTPEKEDLFLQLVTRFNLTRPEDVLPILPVRVNMEDMLQASVNGEFAAISPDSSIWLDQLDRMWQQRHSGAAPLVASSSRYAVSPIVIAMWESRAVELGYPDQPLGWQDLIKKVSDDPTFTWSHQSANTASGLLVTTAEFYAGAGKESGLTLDDLQSPETLEYVTALEGTVELYGGESEDKVVIRMLAEGGNPLDAFVAQEQLVIFFNRNAAGERLVAIYPEEGTFRMDHPLVLLDGQWVREPQRRTFQAFRDFVIEPAQQQLVLESGYRPGDLKTAVTAPGSMIRAEFKVDPAEPKKLLQVPPTGVLEQIREAWRLTKRPANIYLVVDVSGSMAGEPLQRAKEALHSFVDQVQGDRDHLALVAFSGQVNEVERLGPLDVNRRESYAATIRRLDSGGGTKLYDAVAYAYDRLQNRGDAERINVIVAMTDGQSQGNLQVLEQAIRSGNTSVLIFTVAYGDEADLEVLQRIARLGDGQVYPSDSETIGELYRLLSDFF